MKCVLRNNCDNGYLCCNYCKKKSCENRCYDDANKCKYFIQDNNKDVQVSPLHGDVFVRTMERLGEKCKKKEKTGE